MSLRLMTCLLLFCASLPVSARDVKMSGANGDGGTCPDLVAANAHEPPAVAAGKPANAAARARSAKPAAGRGAGDDNVIRAPRWHSFLPGMFR